MSAPAKVRIALAATSNYLEEPIVFSYSWNIPEIFVSKYCDKVWNQCARAEICCRFNISSRISLEKRIIVTCSQAKQMSGAKAGGIC